MAELSMRQETSLRRIVAPMAGVTMIGSDGSISLEWNALIEAADDGDEVLTVGLEPVEAFSGSAGSRQYRITVDEVTDETYERAREQAQAVVDAHPDVREIDREDDDFGEDERAGAPADDDDTLGRQA